MGGPRLPDSLGKDLRDPWPAGQAGRPEEALIPCVHDRGHAVPLGQHGEYDLLGPGHARRPPQGPHHLVSNPRRSGSVTDATTTPWRASGVIRVLMARSRRSYVERWGKRRRALRPASRRRDSTGPVALEPPMGTSTPSWRKVVASGMGTPRSSTAGVPCSPWTQEQDLSTRMSCPVTRSHSSVAGTVSWSAAAPRATAWVSSA